MNLPLQLVALALLAAPPIDGVPEPKPLGALLGQSSLAITGWPEPKGPDGPCGKPLAFWRVREVLKGSKGLKGQVLPVYGRAPQDGSAHTTLLFFSGRSDCPELVAQQEPGVDTLARSIEKPEDCELQLQAVRRVIAGLPDDCDTDRDCEVFSLHPNACERPHAHSRRAKTSTPPYWDALTARAKKACASTWSRQPACAPVAVAAHCHAHSCEEGPAPEALPRLARAVLGDGCAPNDAAATVLSVRPADAEFPVLSVSAWGDGRPLRGQGGSFELKSDGSYKDGLTASYCPALGSCLPLRALRLRGELGPDGKGRVDVEAETQGGEKIEAQVPAEFGPPQRLRCG